MFSEKDVKRKLIILYKVFIEEKWVIDSSNYSNFV